MARQATKRKAPKIDRKSKAAIALEEKSVGVETVSWDQVPAAQYEKCVYWTLRHYANFYDYKDTARWAREWVKKNVQDKQLVENVRRVEDWRISTTVGGLCKMMLNGAQFTEKRMNWIMERLREAAQYGASKKQETQTQTTEEKKSPADIVKERTSDFIAQIEETLDMFNTKTWSDWSEYSVYNELQRGELPYNTAKAVVDYYTPLRNELKELVKKKSDDLVEAYSHLGVRKRKQLLNVVQGIIDDAEKYMATKKAVRKPRKKKAVSATQQTSKVKYLKESAEYKAVSISPEKIVGAKEVYLFNTKTRVATYLTTSSTKGFEIKGTTIQNIDGETSYKKKIRKPEQWLSEVVKATKAKARKTLSDVRSKPSEANGRLNDQTLILKVY
jgi:hypothetical protein